MQQKIHDDSAEREKEKEDEVKKKQVAAKKKKLWSNAARKNRVEIAKVLVEQRSSRQQRVQQWLDENGITQGSLLGTCRDGAVAVGSRCGTNLVRCL